jgi:hypothetical protein
MLYVWQSSPSSYDINVVVIAIINWIDGEISIVVAYFVDFV